MFLLYQVGCLCRLVLKKNSLVLIRLSSAFSSSGGSLDFPGVYFSLERCCPSRIVSSSSSVLS